MYTQTIMGDKHGRHTGLGFWAMAQPLFVLVVKHPKTGKILCSLLCAACGRSSLACSIFTVPATLIDLCTPLSSILIMLISCSFCPLLLLL